MRSRWILVLAALLSPAPLAAAVQDAAEDVPYVLPQTTHFDMTSSAGGAYRIHVSWPKAEPPAQGWPVLYLLDGDVYFPIAASLARNLSGNPEGSGIGPGIVVAIGYPEDSRRDVDYTPTSPPRPEDSDPYLYPEYRTGGADAFLDFVERELKPRIAARWRIDPARQSLSGHAFGGLLTLHAFFTRPESFNTYIASSPSIWFMGRHVLTSERAFLARPSRPAGRRLAITAAEYAQSLPPHQAVDPEFDERLLQNGDRRMIDNAREMVWRLQRAGIDVSWRMFEGENQMSAAYPALSHVISIAFADDGGGAAEPATP